MRVVNCVAHTRKASDADERTADCEGHTDERRTCVGHLDERRTCVGKRQPRPTETSTTGTDAD
jgi:hypothetical protein